MLTSLVINYGNDTEFLGKVKNGENSICLPPQQWGFNVTKSKIHIRIYSDRFGLKWKHSEYFLHVTYNTWIWF